MKRHLVTAAVILAFASLYQRMALRIQGDGAPREPRPATFEDGARTMGVLEALERSAAAQGQWISVPRPPL